MAAANILVVDDDPNLLELLRIRLESGNYQVTTALKEEDALKSAQEQVFDLSIVDLKLAQGHGITLMQHLHLIHPHMPVIILTAHGSIESAVEAMRKGAYSYLTTPFEAQDLFPQIERALEYRRLSSQVDRLKNLLKEKYDFDNTV